MSVFLYFLNTTADKNTKKYLTRLEEKSFKTQFKIEFLLLFNGYKKVLG